MNHCHARSIPLGTPACVCDGSRQSRIVAAKRIPRRRKSHPPSAPTRPAPVVGCGAIDSCRDRETTRSQSSAGDRTRCQTGYPSRLVSATGGAEVRWLPLSCLSRPPTGLARSGGVGNPVGTGEPGWGYDRIVGALANLSFQVSDQTVGNILRRHNIAPAPERSRTTTWKEFIRSHMDVLAGADFFTVEVLTWRGLVTYYVLFFIEVTNRRVSLGGITWHPDSSWMEQVARNASMQDTGYLNGCRYLLHDRDKKFCREFREALEASGGKCIPIPPRSPNLNAHAERWVRSIKEECLTKLILFGEHSLRRVVSNFLEHYHQERNHQGNDNQLLFPAR